MSSSLIHQRLLERAAILLVSSYFLVVALFNRGTSLMLSIVSFSLQFRILTPSPNKLRRNRR
jgi:hypothetical protein